MRNFHLMLLVLSVLCANCLAAEITFQAWSYAMPGEQAFYENLIADFERANPGDTVRFQFGDWEEAHEKIAGWLETKTGPDLVIIPDMWIAEFAKGLTPYVDDLPQSLRNEFFEVLLRKATYRGHTYGLVWATSTKALYYRSDYFLLHNIPGPPKDWDELLEAAKKIHRYDGPYGIGIPVKPTYESTDNWYFFFWSAGGEFFDENGKAAVNSPIGLASLKFYRDLCRRYHVTQPEPTSWSRKDLQNSFVRGKLAMHANGPWLVEDSRKNHPSMQFSVAPLPVAPNRAPFKPRRITQVITDHLMLVKHCAEPELARRFVEFAYQRKYRQAFCELGMVPELKAVAASPFFQVDPDWQVFVNILPDGKFIPLMTWEPIELAAQQMLYKVFTGRQDPQSALDELAETMDKIAAADAARSGAGE